MADHKSLATNKKALHDYEILDTFEAGIMLSGSEIKSLRAGNMNLKGSYVTLSGEVPMLTNAHISHYKPAVDRQEDPTRSRRLLLKASEIKKLIGLLQTEGVAAFPLEVYLSGRWAKVKVGVGRGKKKYDKRESIKKREVDLRMKRAVGRRR